MSHIVKIIAQRERVTHIEYRREFQGIGQTEGSGFSFPCDKDGNLKTDDMHYDCWKGNYDMCVSSPDKFIDRGIVENSWTYMENAKALCSCGKEIELYDEYMGACPCDNCGQWYNIFGQALNKPQYWEEEDDDY